MAEQHSDLNLLYLDEQQNQAFDYEYHSPDELNDKIRYLRARFAPHAPKRFLDVGGGNGAFMDEMLDAFPDAEGWIVDVSRSLLDRNEPNPRKHLVHGSIADADTLLAGRTFDVITINWVLHHLVDRNYPGSIRNMRSVLATLTERLSGQGVLIVGENEYEGFFGSNAPSRLIFSITRVENAAFVRVARRWFNTAGVGVCFQSEGSWRRIFRACGLTVDHYHRNDRWRHGLKRRLMFAVLFLNKARHGHYALVRT